jgi:hypothetical protein
MSPHRWLRQFGVLPAGRVAEPAVRPFSTHPVRRRRRASSTQRSLNPSERFPPGQPKTTELTTHARLKKPAIGEIKVNNRV